MCDFDGGSHAMATRGQYNSNPTVVDLDDLLPCARIVADREEEGRAEPGFVG